MEDLGLLHFVILYVWHCLCPVSAGLRKRLEKCQGSLQKSIGHMLEACSFSLWFPLTAQILLHYLIFQVLAVGSLPSSTSGICSL